MRSLLLWLTLLVAVFCAACSTTPPEVDAVKPATVCGGGSSLTIDGKYFQTNSTVSLNCGGTVVNAESVTYNSDTEIVANFGAGSVASNTTCDVIVKNGDAADAVPHKTVTIIPGPLVFFVDPPNVFNGISTRVTLYATALSQPLPADAVTIALSDGSGSPIQLTYNTVPNHPNRLQAIVPSGTPPGSYDLTMKDNSGCVTTLKNALTVTATLAVTIKSVTPPFGPTASDTAVTILRDTAAAAPANTPFVQTPRVYLNPTNAAASDIAVAMQSVTFLDGDRVTGVVPSGTPAHDYDVVLVNPDGTVGLLPKGYTETTNAPPVIDTVTPSSIKASAGQAVVFAGTNFATGDTITLTCVDGAGNPVAAPNLNAATPVCNGAACTQSVTIDGSTLAAGDVCVARLTNPDGSYGDYSAIGVTTPALNLNSPHKGPDMNVGRRALVAAAGNATSANRFVYAIGGDDGTAAGALDSVEFAPVDIFGKVGAFTVDPVSLPGKRSFAGSVTVGRYIYLIGGDDGTAPVKSALRAMILSPREAPVIDDVDVALGQQGLDSGTYHYRVSATFSATDLDNPNGESLPSDEFTLTLPVFPGNKMAVTLTWKAPVDSLGAPLPNVAGYRVYRTAKDGAPASEVLLTTVGSGSTLTFTDDGTATLGTQMPLPLGSTGTWASLPDLSVPRAGLGVAWANDPATAGTFYVYALLGRTASAIAKASAVKTTEFIKVTTAANGHQTADAQWQATASSTITDGRWEIGAWTANSTVSTLISAYATQSWVFLGGGLDGANGTSTTVEAGLVQAGGQLQALDDTNVKDFSSPIAGYGVCAANEQLFTFGGLQAAPSPGANSAKLTTPPPNLLPGAWNNEGLAMTEERYLLGSAVQSSFIFLLGGNTGTPDPSPASKTTELVIW